MVIRLSDRKKILPSAIALCLRPRVEGRNALFACEGSVRLNERIPPRDVQGCGGDALQSVTPYGFEAKMPMAGAKATGGLIPQALHVALAVNA